MFYIQVYQEGMPQERPVSVNYGPYKTRVGAEAALQRRDWLEDDGKWFPYESYSGDRACARIYQHCNGIKLRSPRSFL